MQVWGNKQEIMRSQKIGYDGRTKKGVGDIGKLLKNRKDLCGIIYLLKANQMIIITY